MITGLKKLGHKPSEPPSPASAERLTLPMVRETIRRLGKEWPKRKKELDAVGNWLTMTQGQMNQVSNRLERLKTWIGLYSTTSEVAKASIRLQVWLTSFRSSRKVKEDWQTVAHWIELHLAPIQDSYERCNCPMRFKQDTDSLSAIEGEAVSILRDVKVEIERIEFGLSKMRAGQDDAECSEMFKQIQNSATSMVKRSVHLCEFLGSAINELVKELGKPIKEL